MGKTSFTNVYCKVQRYQTGNYHLWLFFLLASVMYYHKIFLLHVVYVKFLAAM